MSNDTKYLYECDTTELHAMAVNAVARFLKLTAVRNRLEDHWKHCHATMNSTRDLGKRKRITKRLLRVWRTIDRIELATNATRIACECIHTAVRNRRSVDEGFIYRAALYAANTRTR